MDLFEKAAAPAATALEDPTQDPDRDPTAVTEDPERDDADQIRGRAAVAAQETIRDSTLKKSVFGRCLCVYPNFTTFQSL